MIINYAGRTWDTEKTYWVAYWEFEQYDYDETRSDGRSRFSHKHYCGVEDKSLNVWLHSLKKLKISQAKIYEINFKRDLYESGELQCRGMRLYGAFGDMDAKHFAIATDSENSARTQCDILLQKYHRICGLCGHELGEDAKFCNNCGTKIK